ncbi:actin-related protein 2/3 complex subunit 5-C [Diorhabda carinulata]|uniref:actin-related protein 2/3 complex subunit 5-C n=1 Tax=Diorhabda sublineata TaxID=1163346 RepID=UPI0024E17701|nr:actin-related protein 2/3 complex subunit 5-C [Diorhabda sublineata]XP_057671871.1 actin-related protein 2/3 complex subunit 5-C [Diorhabda carinulata]
MAKNTSSSAFRKIDVDQYSEDNFKEDDTDAGASVGPDENEVNSLLQKGKQLDALKVVLNNAPLGIKNQQIKENAFNLAFKVLIAIKPSQIEEVVNSLDADSLDTLMKYVYKGFEYPSEGSSGHLLLWHEKIYNIAGVGCIVRVLSDTRRI